MKQGGMKKGANAGGAKSGGQKQTKFADPFDGKDDNEEDRDVLNSSDIEWKGTALDRSDRGYADLSEIKKHKEKIKKPWKLTDIMLNNNMLESLDGLSEIPTLVRIEVKDNRLLDARLRLDNLKELDLSRNLLSDVPPLKDLPKIQVLILRGNKIRNIKNKLSIACYTLTRVDLSMNELALEDTNSVRNIVDEFKSLMKVEDIDITDNPVMKQFHGIWRYIAKEVGRQLSRLNKEDINPDEVERIKEQALKPLEDISFANVNEDDGRKTRATARKSGGQDKTDRLSFMLENLELASTTPTRCVEYITKIATAANELITMSEVEWEKIFFSENQKKRIEITEKIDSFLENCVILIENQHSIQNTLLSTLASLTVITTSNFGKRCLLLLGDFLNPGISRQLQAIIKKKIRNIVIPNIQQKKIQDLPLPVLEGLSQIVQDDDLGILFFDTCSYFIGWIKEIHKDCINEGNFQDLPTQKLYKAVLELLSKISLNEEVAKEITSLGVTKYISGIFRSFIRKEPNNNEIYQLLYVLKLIQNTSILGADIAYEYIEAREAKISVIEDIKTSTMIWMDAYKGKNYDLKDTQDPPETQKLKYMLFSSLISTFGALAHFLPNDKLMAVLSEFGYVLLSYAAHQKAEPLLLTSICEFAYNVVTSEAGKHSRTCIENVFNSLGRLLPLMLYMGDTYAPHISTEKYRYLCQSAELYHKGTMIKSEAVRLEANTNPIVHKLFTAIIRLITFICKHANINCNIQEKCQEYSSILNEGGRETILFSCLQIPSDEVKLAIAKCLDEVSVKEIEVDEMAYFSRLISTYKNLGAGRTEEVLSLIFIIMTKVLRDNGASSREFITKYSQNAVGDALDILTRNMERNLKGEPEEQEEKVALSLACIYFLRAASENPTIRVFMVDQNALNGMKRSLYFEELLMRNYPIPIEIESTYIGRNIEYLFRCMAGQESLSPDSIVSFRVISRVADLLMGVKDSPYETLSGEEAIEALRNRVTKDFKQKLKLEITNWDDYADKAREAFKKLISNENEKDNLSQCHKLISSFDGLNRLLLFVIKKELIASKTKDDKRYQVTLNDDFNKKIATLQAKIGRKSHQNIEDPDKKKLKGQFKFFLQAELQRHALSSGQVDKKEIARLILEPPSKASEEAAQEAANEAKKQKHVEVSILAEVIPGFTIDDDKRVRIFIVSAVLRVIYAAVNFFVDVDTKKRALQQIKNIQILLPLTELCASIGWTNSNIATKYFTIMFALLEELQQDPNESLTIEIFDIISKVIADVLKLLRRKIQNVEKVPLSLEDEKLLLNLTYCTSLMCSRLSSMQLLKDAKMDQLIIAYKEQNKDRDNGHGISSLKPEGIIRQTAMRFLLVRLVPLHIIYTLLDIVFINMSKYANPGQGSKISEYERAEKTNIGIAQLLGEYLANCVDFKYSILKYFVDAEIYDNRIVRQTFLQEVLIQEQLCKLRSNIQEYCKQSNFISPTGEVFRMVFYGEMTEVGGKKWKKKLFGFTNLAFYVFSPSNNRPCSLCPPDSLCPEGPSLDYKIPFSDLTFCVNFLKTARIGIAFVQEKKGFTKLLSKETKQEVKLIISLVGTPDKDGAVYQLVTNGIHVIQDNLLLSVLETQLNTKIDDNYFIAVVRMISSKEANVTRQSFFDEKRIVVFSQEDLYIFSEAVEYWVVELPEAEIIEDDKELLDPEAKLKLAEVDLRKKATMYLAKQVKKMSLYSIASFLTEDNGIPIGEIKAGKDEMKMIFGEECELDRFRVELFRRIAKTKPQMKVEVYSALRPR